MQKARGQSDAILSAVAQATILDAGATTVRWEGKAFLCNQRSEPLPNEVFPYEAHVSSSWIKQGGGCCMPCNRPTLVDLFRSCRLRWV